MRLAILASHPVQYYAPLFREVARRVDLQVLYAHRPTSEQQAAAGFGTAFDWDVDLHSGYSHKFLSNISNKPCTQDFAGCDTPAVFSEIRDGKFNVVMAMGWHLKSYIQGILAAKRAGIPVMVRGDSHLETPRHMVKRLAKAAIYPTLLRIFDAVLYVGVRNREYYEHYGFPRSRMFQALHCVDTCWFATRATEEAGRRLRSELNIPSHDEVVLFAGKLLPFKRPLDVVDAVAEVAKARSVCLMVAGSGQMESQLIEHAFARGVRLHNLGFCNQSRMPEVYSASRVLVLPSSGSETWGLVCNEAIACGRPIVISDAVGCAPDLASDVAVGRSFPLGDTIGLAAAISATLDTPIAVDRLRRVSKVYSIRATVDGIEEALHALCS